MGSLYPRPTGKVVVITLPTIAERSSQPYCAVRISVTMAELEATATAGVARLFGLLGERGIEPAGSLFFRYLTIDMAAELEIDIGCALEEPIEPDAELVCGYIPSGRYAVVTYLGAYEGLFDVNALLIGWAKERRVAFDMHATAKGDAFGGRFEFYLTDPADEPDPEKWRTELAIRLADDAVFP